MLTDLTDEKLMKLYQEGDYDAFVLIYQRCQGRVLSYLRKHLKDMNAVEDIFQNIFVKFHKSRTKYNSNYPLLAWLYTICRCELLDYLKKPTLRYVELREEHATTTEQTTTVHLDIDREKHLTAREKSILKLKYFSDQDYKEIAQTLGFTHVSVRKTSSRGIKKLRLKYGTTR